MSMGINVQPGSADEKIWWGFVLCLTGIGAFIGIPMIIIGIVQSMKGLGQSSNGLGLTGDFWGVTPEPPSLPALPPSKQYIAEGWERQGKAAFNRGDLKSAEVCYAEADKLRRESVAH